MAEKYDPAERFGPHPPPLEDHHNPMIRVKEEGVELMRLLMTHVQVAIKAELDAREIPEGAVAALEVSGHERSPHSFGIVFTVRMRAPGDSTIEFRGTL
jgi:hypothetical protein